MTVASDNSHIQYAGNGVTKTFAAPFYFLLNSDISVQISDADGNVTDLVNGTNFSVTGAGNAGGGSVTLNVAYAAGYTILVYRNPPITQETAYYENGKFPAKSHEKALDKLTMLIQKFGWLFDVLALKKPSILAKYYDAKGNRIANLSDPVKAQDATTKAYVDAADANLQGQVTGNFQRTLRVPEGNVGLVPDVAHRRESILGFDSGGNPVPIFSWTETADLAVKLASKQGGSLIGLEQGGTVQDALHGVIYTAMFRYLVADGDWAPVFRMARDVALAFGFKAVCHNAGPAQFISFEAQGLELPRDDGTIDPRRPDAVLAPEEAVIQPVHVNWPSQLNLTTRDMSYDTISSVWDGKTVDTNQPIVFCKRVLGWDGTYLASTTAKNRMTRVIWGSDFSNVHFENAFIAIVCDGIEARPNWGNISFKNVGLGIVSLGVESGSRGRITHEKTVCPVVIGGWWLRRDDVKHQSGIYIPPYVAGTEPYSSGWIDNHKIEDIDGTHEDHNNPEVRALYRAADEYFDKYFWKSANSKPVGTVTAYGEPGRGRLSKYGAGLTTGLSTLEADNPYRGVSMSSLVESSRYNRGNSNNELGRIKSRKTPRGPIWINNDQGPAGIALIVRNAYIEDSGKVDYSNTNQVAGGPNDWFASGLDELNTDMSQMQYYIGRGPITTQFISPTASIVCDPSFSNHGGSGPRRNIMVGKNDGSSRFIETWSLYDPSKSSGAYSWLCALYTTHAYLKAINFSSDINYPIANMFRYAERGLLSSDLALFSKNGTSFTTLSPTSLICRMVKAGSRVRLYLSFTLSSSDVASNDQFVIGIRRYSIYDYSTEPGIGAYPLLSIARGAFTATQVPTTTSGVNLGIENSPKGIHHGGYVTIDDVRYHAFEVYRNTLSSVAYPVSSMTSGSQMTFVIEYESFSPIDSIPLS